MRTNETKNDDAERRSLSKAESALVLEMEWKHQASISLKEIQSLLGCSETYARSLAHRLTQKGWFERLRRGVYMLIPADRGREGIGDTNPFIDTHVFEVEAFYSFGTACSYYGFTDQVFTEMYLVTSKRRLPLEIRGKKYVFARVPSKHFFGFQKANVYGRDIQMALPERAVLDALERPEYAGGLSEVSRIIQRAAMKLDHRRLVELARQWDQSAIVQRLGFFLDLHEVPIASEIRKQLKALVRPGNKIHLAPRDRSQKPTQFNSDWLVVENISRKLLIDNSIGKKRFIPKPKAKESL